MTKESLGLFEKYARIISFTKPEILKTLYTIVDGIDGWLVPHQVFLLYYIGLLNSGRLVEIGSWKGRSTCTLLLGGNLLIDAVDTFHGSDSDERHKELLSKENGSSLSDFHKNITKFNFNNRVTIRCGYSVEVSKLFEDNSIDLLFIDGGHDYENVKNDIFYWTPKLKSGGIIFGHDYPEESATDFQELKKAVDEYVKNKPDIFTLFGSYIGVWGAYKK